MKYALVNPNEKVFDPNTQQQIGVRACDVLDTPFEVHPSLLWVECGDNVVANEWCYVEATKQFIKVPAWIPPVAEDQPTSSGTQNL